MNYYKHNVTGQIVRMKEVDNNTKIVEEYDDNTEKFMEAYFILSKESLNQWHEKFTKLNMNGMITNES